MPDLVLPHTIDINTEIIAVEHQANYEAIRDTINALDGDNFATATAEQLGLNQTGVRRAGKSIVATEQSRTNAAYGHMTTHDEVLDIVLPTDGIIYVAYLCQAKSSVASAVRAGLFLNATQVQRYSTSAGTLVPVEANDVHEANIYKSLSTNRLQGLQIASNVGAYSDPVTTGQVISNGPDGGGEIAIFAAAGTYDVSIQWKSSSGSVTVKNRKLWAWTRGF